MLRLSVWFLIKILSKLDFNCKRSKNEKKFIYELNMLFLKKFESFS